MSQIITVTFPAGKNMAIAAEPLEQWAYGQKLQFAGLDLPASYQVDFSNFEFCGSSIPRVGGPDGVTVPVEVLTSGRNVYAFIWLQDATSGARYYRATIRVIPGPAPDPETSPEEESAVTDAINALNDAAEAIPSEIQSALEAALDVAKQSGEFDGNRIWYSTIVPDKISSTVSQLAFSQLSGVPDATPQIGDLVIAPEPAFYPTPDPITGTPTFLLVITETPAFYNLARMASVGSLRGAQGIRGEQGPRGLQGEPGLGFPAGGTSLYVLRKKTDADYDTEWANPMDLMSDDVKQALLQLARKVAYIDAQGETYYQDLYDALYPPAVLASIQAAFAQGSTVIYNTDSLDVLKPLLTVTAVYDDGSTETVPAADYTLSGTLATGISTITASYQGKTATFQVTVTAAPMAFPVTNNLTNCSSSNSAAAVMENEPYSAVITPTAGYTLTGASVVITMAGSNITASAYSGGVINIARVTGALVISIVAQQIVLSSISAAYTQSGVVYNTDTLESLKADLVVTAAYSDGTSTVLAADAYTLSGTLTAGTSTITVSYQGKSTTFQVQVTAAPQVYLVTNELTGCTTDNSAASVVEGSAYAARITASTGYTLVGAVVTITMGGQDITASAYSGGVISIPAVTGALVISVAAVAVVLSSISAVYTQSGTVYDTDTLDSLKADLVVTANYSDSSTQTVPAADYTLSGTLTAGTSTITVSYGGKTTTFSVTVTESGVLPAGYEAVDYVFSPSESASGPIIDTGVRLSGVGNTIVEISFMDYSTVNSYPIGCLSSTSSETVGFGVSIRNNSNKDVIAFTGGTPASISPSPLNSVRIDAVATINSSGISISDGTLLNTQTLTPRAYNVANLYLFGIKKPTTNGVVYPFTGRIYYARITENDVVLAELLPCIRLTDGMAGFWDTVNSRFVYASELVAAPSEHNTTAEIDQGGKMLVHYTTEPKFRTKNMANCGITQKYAMTGGESLVLYPAGIIPTDAISSMYNGGDAAILVVYDENDNPISYVDEIKQSEFYRWAQNANGTMTEFSQSWNLQTAYSKIAISVDMRYLHDAYMYDKTSGQVWFAGRNTPYYGMSNISEAQ